MSGTRTVCLIEQIERCLHFQEVVDVKLIGKLSRSFFVYHEFITSKKHAELFKRQHFFGFQLARAAPVLLEAGGKLSTMFPPEGLEELPQAQKSKIFYSQHFHEICLVLKPYDEQGERKQGQEQRTKQTDRQTDRQTEGEGEAKARGRWRGHRKRRAQWA